MIGGRRPLQGRKPADRRVRVERPHSPYFRYTGRASSSRRPPPTSRRPRSGGRGRASGRRVRPSAGERGGGRRAAVQEEGARDLQLRRDQLVGLRDAGDHPGPRASPAPPRSPSRSASRSRSRSSWRSSRSRTARSVARIPNGGGAYAVAKENLSPLFGLIAAAALLIDYVMTVAVSTASAIGQIVSVVPELDPVKIEIAVSVIALITIANLRGLRESGNIFAVPTYAFVGLALLMVGLGLVNIVTGTAHPIVTPERGAARRGGAVDLPAAQGVRRRLRGADRRRGDRERRARRSSRPRRRTRRTR